MKARRVKALKPEKTGDRKLRPREEEGDCGEEDGGGRRSGREKAQGRPSRE